MLFTLDAALAILGSSAVTGVLSSLFTRRQVKANARKTETEAEVDTAHAAMEFAKQVEESFKNQIEVLQRQVDRMAVAEKQMQSDFAKLYSENLQLRQKVAILETEIIKRGGSSLVIDTPSV